MIELSGVAKAFGARQILRDINFTVKAGEVACLIGPSGSGKSTILRTINGLERHDAGTITVDGTLLSDKSLPAIRRKVSMVFQRFNLFPHRTVIENIIEGPVHVLREDPETARIRAIELLGRESVVHRLRAARARL